MKKAQRSGSRFVSALVLALLGFSGAAHAESAFGLSTSGGPVSASVKLVIKVVIQPSTTLRLSERGAVEFSNVRTSRNWSCGFTKVASSDEPRSSAELAGTPCVVRSVTPQQAADHGAFSGFTFTIL